jgi:peroxiredoxin
MFVLGGCAGAPPSQDAKLPANMPVVELTTLDGKPARVDTLTSGKVAVLAFWAPWCEACDAELGALKRLQDSASPRGGIVVAVAVGEPRAKVAEFVATRELRYPQLVDEQFRLADALGQRRVPATLVIDHTGRFTYAGGALDAEALTAVRAALDAAPTLARN